jgi:hypothetical protein|nr:MAG TPA: hypothetical protein [Caudoviricetes sp.]
MITVSTRDYTTEQLKYLSAALYTVKYRIFESDECIEETQCTPQCKAYAFCTDIGSTWAYINKKIREREALELHRDTQESK